jgi:hypothetical protein
MIAIDVIADQLVGLKRAMQILRRTTETDLGQTVTPPKQEASETGGLLSLQLINELINEFNSFINSIQLEATPPKQEASEIGGVAQRPASTNGTKRVATAGDPSKFRWPPKLFRDMNAKSLNDPRFVDECLTFLARSGWWETGPEGRVLFFATVVEAQKIKPTAPGGVLTNIVRNSERDPCTQASIDIARTALANLAKRQTGDSESELARVVAQRHRELKVQTVTDPGDLGPAVAAVLRGVGAAPC